MGLRFFKRGNKYNGVSDALHSIRQEFEAIWSKIDNYTAPEDSVASEQSSYIPDIGSNVDSSYNSYFKVILSNDAETYVLKVVDGESYDDASNTCYPSYAYINGESFAVQLWEYTVTDVQQLSGMLVCLRHTSAGATETDDGSKSQATVDIVTLNDLPSDTSDEAFYVIARFYVTNGNVTIKQEHITGAIRFNHGIDCSRLYWEDGDV